MLSTKTVKYHTAIQVQGVLFRPVINRSRMLMPLIMKDVLYGLIGRRAVVSFHHLYALSNQRAFRSINLRIGAVSSAFHE